MHNASSEIAAARAVERLLTLPLQRLIDACEHGSAAELLAHAATLRQAALTIEASAPRIGAAGGDWNRCGLAHALPLLLRELANASTRAALAAQQAERARAAAAPDTTPAIAAAQADPQLEAMNRANADLHPPRVIALVPRVRP